MRDIVAHLLDTALRRLSVDRDGRMPPRPPRPIEGEGDLAGFINDLNATWVRAAERLSSRTLTDLYAAASEGLSDFRENVNLDGPARFPVSWAGRVGSHAWLDIGREFTEVWHHGAQIRDAVNAGPFPEARWLHAVLAIAVHAIPHAYREVRGEIGQAVALDIVGLAGGAWTLTAREASWAIDDGRYPEPSATVTMSDDAAWRLFFNALPSAQSLVQLTGDVGLAAPLLRVRSVIV